MSMRHLLTLSDLSRSEILGILDLADGYKSLRRRGVRFTGELRGKSVALIFEKPSTRTRASFSVAVYEMGGMPMVYGRDELQLARGEPVKDTARVLSRYHAAIAARVYRHETLEELSRYSNVPVINLLSDKFHPLQALADYMTIRERLGRLEGVKMLFVGDGNDNVFRSLALAGLKLGVEVRVACPPEYSPSREELERLAGEVRGCLRIFRDPYEAVEGVDVVYTDVFVSMGQEEERERRLKVFVPGYTVTLNLLDRAGDDVLFMHCLPAHRGEEVEDAVMEDRRSVVFDQAENRLHTAKAVLAFLLGD